MWQFCLSALRSGFRSRSVHAILVLGVLLVGVAYLAAAFSPRQPKTTALDVGLSGIRFSLVLFALFWTQDLVGREVERRTIVHALTHPVARSAYLLGRYLGVLGLLAVATVLLGLLLEVTTLAAGGAYEQSFRVHLGVPYWTTLFGLWLDAAVVAAFALWIASLSTVTMLPVALGAAFAIASRALGAVVDYLGRGADGDVQLAARFTPLVDVVRWLLPDLSRLDWRVWPMYGLPPGDSAIIYGALMAGGYACVLFALGVMTFSRRDFA